MSRPIPYNNPLVRKKWLLENMLAVRKNSFFSSYIGQGKDSIIYQTNFNLAKDGHQVTFQYWGELNGSAVADKDKATGTGEQTKNYFNQLTVRRYRKVVDNGDPWDATQFGDLSQTMHSNSVAALAAWHMKWKDQYFFDVLQGNVKIAGRGDTLQPATHEINAGAITYDSLVKIEQVLKDSRGFDKGGIRAPLEPMMNTEGTPMWILLLDLKQIYALRKDSDFKTIMTSADVRGYDNTLLKGVVARLGNLFIVEAPTCMGHIPGATSGWDPKHIAPEIAGLRRKDSSNRWSAQDGFDESTAQSFGYILGRNAMQVGMGEAPDYMFQESNDFKITSESAIKWTMNAQKTLYTSVFEDMEQAKHAGIDNGVIQINFS